ncbi:MAG: hypothetical protein IJ205_04915, partial [Bacteroidales bacterium]|nr:hypothetical protein [Bacteroidales bacterium]
METNITKLESLTMDQLTGVITTYPWFGAARRELCERMSKVGGSEWGKAEYADAAMYIASRTIVSDIVRSTRQEDYSDKDVQTLLHSFILSEAKDLSEPSVTQTYRRTVKVVGGDFFSSDQYDSVMREEDNYFSRFKVGRSDEKEERNWEDPELGFCTETLAWIYAEQGYFTEAKKIYSRLILRYPEKSAYFA